MTRVGCPEAMAGERQVVVLLCGPAGSGKSHLARALERAGWTRLSIDELAWGRGWHHHPLGEAEIAWLHDTLTRQLMDAVARGSNVVVDASFWSRTRRDRYRELPFGRDVDVEVWYLRTPESVLRARVAARTNSGPDDVALTQEVLTGFLAGFEVPTPQEGTVRVIPGFTAGQERGH